MGPVLHLEQYTAAREQIRSALAYAEARAAALAEGEHGFELVLECGQDEYVDRRVLPGAIGGVGRGG